MKSVSQKCRLQTYCLDSFLACSALQGMSSLSPHSWALCKNGTRKYKNKTVITMISVLCYIFTARWTPFVTQTIHCVLCWLQHIGQTLEMNKFVSKIWHNLKIQNVEITVCVQHTRFLQDTTWYIFSSQDNDSWTMKYNSFVAWISVITKSHLSLQILRKHEAFKVTMCRCCNTLCILLAIQ